MTLGPLQDRVWLHVGARPPEYVERLARLAGGVALQAPLSSPRARELARSDLPVLLQHDAREDHGQPTLLTPDDAWLLDQTGSAIVASRVRWVPRPSPTSEQVLREAVREARSFLRLAREQAPTKPSMAIFAFPYLWLTSAKPRSQLLAALQSVGGPIGLMLGKEQDPLDNPRRGGAGGDRSVGGSGRGPSLRSRCARRVCVRRLGRLNWDWHLNAALHPFRQSQLGGSQRPDAAAVPPLPHGLVERVAAAVLRG